MEKIIFVTPLAGLCFLSLNASQYRFVSFPTPKTWYDAQIYCRENCLDLATIFYMEEMNEVLTLVKGGNDDAVWFGLSEGKTRSWHWSLIGKDLYKQGEETFLPWGAPQQYHCGFYRQEMLYTLACHNVLPFICFDATKEGKDKYIMVEEPMSWINAMNYCKTHYTDLTSVRNDAEIGFIQNLASNGSVWVGLFRDSWVWSDKANSSFRYWPPATSVWSNSTDSCGALLKKESGRWGGLNCMEMHPFVCSCAPDEAECE